ncbi:hypothetical protein Pen02_25940 [Plantactinospora endophytica]|uniref:Uncharacterized protein n=1 Tax=Plantactinospora endophytica TaxID=673535 RepID=A0ABQ4DYY3_9ACTN|nr:hypothetical protein Pen02_25940 [Plantactinospora endophytica]
MTVGAAVDAVRAGSAPVDAVSVWLGALGQQERSAAVGVAYASRGNPCGAAGTQAARVGRCYPSPCTVQGRGIPASAAGSIGRRRTVVGHETTATRRQRCAS